MSEVEHNAHTQDLLWLRFFIFRQDLQDFEDYFLSFLTFQKKVRKPNPLSAEYYFFYLTAVLPGIFL
jgi:hypothetical protein